LWQWGVVALMVAAVPTGDEADSAADRARVAFAARLQVDAEAVEVLEVEPAEWPDAALGCPEKGKVYAQVLTSGYRVLLGHGDRHHWLHVAGANVVDCEETSALASRRSIVEAMAQATRDARRDLAARLGIEEAAVEAKRVRPITDPVDLDGCPATPRASSDEAGTLLLTLRARGTTYRYRSDRGTLTDCGPS
jgi:hypothetical protein